MKLPFKIHDGKKYRPCTYEDLFIIVTWGLDYTIHGKRKYLISRKMPNYTLVDMYNALTKLRDLNSIYSPLNYLTMVSFLESRIGHIKCKELHKWKANGMVRLIVQMEIG